MISIWHINFFYREGTVQDNEMDTILLLTNSFFYIVSYDDELDSLSSYQKIALTDLYAIDIGKYTCLLSRHVFFL